MTRLSAASRGVSRSVDCGDRVLLRSCWILHCHTRRWHCSTVAPLVVVPGFFSARVNALLLYSFATSKLVTGPEGDPKPHRRNTDPSSDTGRVRLHRKRSWCLLDRETGLCGVTGIDGCFLDLQASSVDRFWTLGRVGCAHPFRIIEFFP